MLRRFRVAPRLTAAFLTVLAAVVAAAGVGMWKMGAIKSEVVFVADNTMPAISQLEAVVDGLSEARMNQMFLSSVTDPADRTEHKGLLAEQRARIDKALKAYEPTIATDKDRELFDRTKADVTAYFDRVDAVAARTTPGPGGLESMHASQELFDTTQAHLEEYIKYNNSLGDKAIAASNSAYGSGRTMLIAFVVCALAAGLALAIMIAKSVTRPLDDLRTKLGHVGEGDLTVRVAAEGKDELTEVSTAFNAFAERMQGTVRDAAEASRRQIDLAEDMARGAEQSGMAIAQIATTVDEIARGSQDQAEATARVNDTMEEMSEGVRRVAHSGESAAGMAQDADHAATEGSETVRQATEAIAGIERRVAEASEIVVALGERGAQVGQIVDTISDIAGQTNLLALNAAIEAARAGEQGRGFAVVAEEVRQLAEGTQQQVGSISSIVREIQDHTQRAVLAMEAGRAEVEQGVQRVAAAGGAFDTIRDSVGTLSSEVMSVAAAAQQLEAGSTEVREALHGVAAVSEENAASVEQVSASTEETSASAQETAASAQQVAGSARTLADMMETFKV